MRVPSMQLNEALAQITLIREQLARTKVFRGFRSLTVGFSGILAILTAGIQSVWIAQPSRQIGAYLTLWVGTAGVSVAVCGAEMYVRLRRARSPSSRQLTNLAVGQFMPCVAAGALVTTVIARYSVEAAWMLPGLWATLFSLGVFATFRLLPRPVFWVAVYYLACGVACLRLGPEHALSPWTMAATFGIGQLLTAFLLYWNLERLYVRGP